MHIKHLTIKKSQNFVDPEITVIYKQLSQSGSSGNHCTDQEVIYYKNGLTYL